MLIEYKNSNMRKVCTNASIAIQKYGSAMAEKIQQRIQELSAADSVETMIRFRIGRCHQLHGNRKSQYALDLVSGWRLIFEKKNGEIKIVTIQEITNYH